MSYRFYTKSDTTWSAMYQAISESTQSVYLEMYIFLDDTDATHDFVGLLISKAQSGVKVVIVLDAFGSWALSSTAINNLKAAGVELHYFSNLLRRSHRKILIVDEQTAFIGGVNIKEGARYWGDLAMCLTGPIIKPMLKSFAYTYKIAGGKNQDILKYSEKSVRRKIKSWLVDNWPRPSKSYYLDDYYREKISGATQLVQIVTPYLAPPRWLLALIDGALRRGVRVEIIMPQNTDYRILNKVNYINSFRLAALGANCYFLPHMNHAKLMLVDSAEGVVGSQNFDFLSFGINLEAGVFFSQKNAVTKLSKIIEQWKHISEPFVYQEHKITWRDKILLAIIKFLSPIFK